MFELNPANASSVVKATKEAFSRHGIPETVISGNGSQYSSKQYKQAICTRVAVLTQNFKPKISDSPTFFLAESSVKV